MGTPQPHNVNPEYTKLTALLTPHVANAVEYMLNYHNGNSEVVHKALHEVKMLTSADEDQYCETQPNPQVVTTVDSIMHTLIRDHEELERVRNTTTHAAYNFWLGVQEYSPLIMRKALSALIVLEDEQRYSNTTSKTKE